jgi:hypothetical protein
MVAEHSKLPPPILQNKIAITLDRVQFPSSQLSKLLRNASLNVSTFPTFTN